MSNLSVKVTADVVDLQTKFAVAKAETQGLSSELNKLARAQAAGTIDSAGTARMQQLAGDLLAAKTQAAGYAASLERAGFSTSSFGRATESMHGSISSATREFRALFDELSSGRTRMTPGTLAIIAQRVLGLSGTTLAAVAGVGALVGGLVYLAMRAKEASDALDLMHVSSLEAGNAIGRIQFQQLVDQLAQLPGVSSSTADEVVTSLDKLHMPFEAFTAASRLAAEQMRITGQDASAAGAEMAKALEPSRTAEDVAKGIAGLSQAQLNAARAADLSGNANAVLAEKLSLLGAEIGRARGETTEYTRSWGEAISQFFGFNQTTAAMAGNMAERFKPSVVIAQQLAQAWSASAAAVKQATASLAAMPADPQQQLQAALQTADRESAGSSSQRMTQMKADIEQMSQQLAKLKGTSDTLDMARLNAGLDATRAKLAELQLEPLKKQFDELDAEYQVSVEQREQDERQFTDQLKQEQQTRQQIERMTADTAVAISRMKLEAEKEEIESEIAANRDGAAQKYAILKQLTEQEAELDIQNLQSELATLQQGTVEYQRVYDQILELKAKLAVSLADIDKQIAASSKQAVNDDVRSWRSGISEIEGAEGTLVSDLLGRRMSLSQSLIRMSSQLAEKEITDDLKYVTTSIAAHFGLATQKEALDQQGTLLHGLMMLTQSGQTTTSQQLQEVQVTASYAAQTVAARASQTAQTSAVAAGAAARTAAVSTATAAGQAQQAAATSQTIAQDAGKAFAGTYQGVSQIPYGWIVAPALAAAAMAVVASKASLEVGTPYIPQTGLYQLHQGEAVMPKSWAQGMRDGDLGSFGAGAQAQSGGGDTHFHVGFNALDAQSVSGLFTSSAGRNMLAGALMKYAGRGGRPRP